MTENEMEFFHRLVVALPNLYIFPQVAMSALVDAASANSKQAYRDRLRVAQQRIDFVVADGEGKVIAIIELDDRTHNAAKDKLRDQRTEQAGYRTIRFQSKNKPTYEQIRQALLSPSSSTSAPDSQSPHASQESKERNNIVSLAK